MSKTISFGLSVSELDKTMQAVKDYQVDFNRKLQTFAERLAAEGIFIAKNNISNEDAIDTGELQASIMSECHADAVTGNVEAIIYTDCPYAKYVEFGFGIVGSEDPHPDTSIIGWKYDINQHGEKGWMYQKNGEWYWSKGQPSKPFMWQMSVELRTKITTIAKEVFSG